MTDRSHDDEMLAHIRSTVAPATVDRAEILSELKAMHIVTGDDEAIDVELDQMVAHILAGNSQEGYALTITGKSGAGKTTSLNRRLDAHPSFKPFLGKYGNQLSLSLRATTPSSCTAKTLGKELLARTGYVLQSDRDEHDIWRILLERMEKMQTRILVLDEFQHVLDAPTSKKYMHLSNTIKNLLINDGRPIWLILSGVPSIVDFIDRDPAKQLDRRAPLIEITGLKDTQEDLERITDVVYELVEACGLTLGFAPTRDFLLRLMHGGIWRFGMTVQIVKNAIERGLWDKSWTKEKGAVLHHRHFAEGYRRLARNCSAETNVFLIDDWFHIQREVDDEGRLVDAATPRKRGRPRKV
jgi:hypothetical protein